MVTEITRPKPIEGPLETEFWGYVGKHERRVQECTDCHHLCYPPATFCSECLSFEYQWRRLTERGKVLSWVRFQRQYFPGLPVPYDVVLVEMDDGPLMMANLTEVPASGIHTDMRVRVVFEPVTPDWTIFQFQPEA